MPVARTLGEVPRIDEQCWGLAYMETHWFTLVDLGEVTWTRAEVTRQSYMGSQLEPGREPRASQNVRPRGPREELGKEGRGRGSQT